MIATISGLKSILATVVAAAAAIATITGCRVLKMAASQPPASRLTSPFYFCDNFLGKTIGPSSKYRIKFSLAN